MGGGGLETDLNFRNIGIKWLLRKLYNWNSAPYDSNNRETQGELNHAPQIIGIAALERAVPETLYSKAQETS